MRNMRIEGEAKRNTHQCIFMRKHKKATTIKNPKGQHSRGARSALINKNKQTDTKNKNHVEAPELVGASTVGGPVT
jgi:hypothetical protein